MGINGFKNLEVWNKSKDFAIEIYKLTEKDVFVKDYGLKDQIRRAVVSIPSNIAEGDERYTNKDSIRFLYIAKGSLAELITQLEISNGIGYINNDELKILNNKCNELGRMLGGLIKARRRKEVPVPPITYSTHSTNTGGA